jgi:hypothetical protein
MEEMKKNVCVAINEEVWEDFGRYAIIKERYRGELLEELIKTVIKEHGENIRQLKKIQTNS